MVLLALHVLALHVLATVHVNMRFIIKSHILSIVPIKCVYSNCVISYIISA